MYFFDKEYLAQYVDQKVKLKVLYDGGWYSVTSQKDLDDDVELVAYDEYGASTYIDYREIEGIKALGRIITIDALQTIMTDEPPAEEEAKPEAEEEAPVDEPMGGDEPPVEEEPEEEESKPEKTPQKSNYDPYMIGRYILKEHERQNRKRIR